MFLTARFRDGPGASLTSGADDCDKAFSLEELVARLRGLLRRSSHLKAPMRASGSGNLTLDGAGRGNPHCRSRSPRPSSDCFDSLMHAIPTSAGPLPGLDRVWNYIYQAAPAFVGLAYL